MIKKRNSKIKITGADSNSWISHYLQVQEVFNPYIQQVSVHDWEPRSNMNHHEPQKDLSYFHLKIDKYKQLKLSSCGAP